MIRLTSPNSGGYETHYVRLFDGAVLECSEVASDIAKQMQGVRGEGK